MRFCARPDIKVKCSKVAGNLIDLADGDPPGASSGAAT
jgi:hypothetical protein